MEEVNKEFDYVTEEYDLYDPELEFVPYERKRHFVEVIFLTIFVLLLIIGLLLNTVALFQQIRSVRSGMLYGKQKTETILKINILVANVMTLIFGWLVDLTWHLTDQWLGGNALCKIVMFLRPFSLYGNVYSVIAILASHLINKYSKKQEHPSTDSPLMYLKFLIPVWVCSFAMCAPQLWFAGTGLSYSYHIDCRVNINNNWQHDIYAFIHGITFFFIPLIILMVLCIVIFRLTRLENRRRSAELLEEKEMEQAVTSGGISCNDYQTGNDEGDPESKRNRHGKNIADEPTIDEVEDGFADTDNVTADNSSQTSDLPLVIGLITLSSLIPVTAFALLELMVAISRQSLGFFLLLYIGIIYHGAMILMDTNVRKMRWF